MSTMCTCRRFLESTTCFKPHCRSRGGDSKRGLAAGEHAHDYPVWIIWAGPTTAALSSSLKLAVEGRCSEASE